MKKNLTPSFILSAVAVAYAVANSALENVVRQSQHILLQARGVGGQLITRQPFVVFAI